MSKIESRYSESFKRELVHQIEQGEIGIEVARLAHGIGGKMTLYRWVKQYGSPTLRTPLMNNDKHPANETDKSKITRLEQRVKQLEKLTVELNIDKVILEEIINVASEFYGTDIKKKVAQQQSGACKGKK